MIEPDLKYCPQCDDEYLPEIRLCAACGIELISGTEKLARVEARQRRLESRVVELTPDDELVNIRRGPLADIKRLENLFREERIGTLIAADESACGKGCCPTSFFLRVRRQDAREAMELLDWDFRRTTGLDGHDVKHANAVYDAATEEAVCPACGHAFSTTTSTCPDCGLCFG
ncbi:MAG: hypothetical protein A2521_03220 [Deltaproteobacteria bacterium RIFOXYD12_FULL_57_12]|nr:MAG: hypothetical protein A2521_03220 [Deltaproteobacteria bacterium RIFOXYD12_FULL_57_12]